MIPIPVFPWDAGNRVARCPDPWGQPTTDDAATALCLSRSRIQAEAH
jgi:hypothetical protein